MTVIKMDFTRDGAVVGAGWKRGGDTVTLSLIGGPAGSGGTEEVEVKLSVQDARDLCDNLSIALKHL